ncbi:hypothetical protein AB0N92_18130 [Streptomyces sp. NPDC093248]|uniref:hypothetical protein n=1 Tax=Streptomyces sp. NPDC093248 TaxID=3155072 RepID=UPI0034484D0A
MRVISSLGPGVVWGRVAAFTGQGLGGRAGVGGHGHTWDGPRAADKRVRQILRDLGADGLIVKNDLQRGCGDWLPDCVTPQEA